MVLLTIPFATFGGVDQESEVEVVAGAHDLEGHGSTLMLFCSRLFIVTHAVRRLALSCWNNSLCRSITCMRWGWRTSSLYRTAVKFPGTCTMSALRSFEIASHIMILPPPKLSTSWAQEEEKHSFRRLYTGILPSRFCSRKRDRSLNQILRQYRNVQPLNLLHQRTLSRQCNGVNTSPKYGLLCRMPYCLSRLRLFVS